MKKVISLALLIVVLLTFNLTIYANFIIVNDKNITLNVGDTYQIEVENIQEFNSVSYESKNNDVCSVSDEGLITALTKGSSIVLINADEFEFELYVLVEEKSDEIILLEDRAIVKINETYQIKAVNNGTEKLEYKSLDENICTVTNSGLIEPKNIGKTTIKISTELIEVYFTITILPIIDKLEFKDNNLVLEIGDTKNIEVSNISFAADYNYISNNTNICTVNASGKLEAKGVGSAVIIVSIGDIFGEVFVEVKEKSEIIATNIIVKNSNINILVNDMYQIEYELEPIDSTSVVTFTDYDSNIIEVSNTGLIKAKMVGQTSITINAGQSMVKVNVVVNEIKSNSFNPLYIVIPVVGIVVIGLVSGVLVFKKKTSKSKGKME